MKFPIWRRFKTNKNTEYFSNKEYTWCIDLLLEVIVKYKIIVQNKQINDIKHLLNESEIDIPYALESDRQEPIIIIETFNHKEIIVDGNHRLYRDMHNQKESILVYKVPFHLAPIALIEKDMYKDFIMTYRTLLKDTYL